MQGFLHAIFISFTLLENRDSNTYMSRRSRKKATTITDTILLPLYTESEALRMFFKFCALTWVLFILSSLNEPKGKFMKLSS